MWTSGSLFVVTAVLLWLSPVGPADGIGTSQSRRPAERACATAPTGAGEGASAVPSRHSKRYWTALYP